MSACLIDYQDYTRRFKQERLRKWDLTEFLKETEESEEDEESFEQYEDHMDSWGTLEYKLRDISVQYGRESEIYGAVVISDTSVGNEENIGDHTEVLDDLGISRGLSTIMSRSREIWGILLDVWIF